MVEASRAVGRVCIRCGCARGAMSMADIVRMGVVGAGAIALRGILPHLSQADVQNRVRLQAVCDPVPGRAAAAAEKYGVAQAFTTYEELLEAGEVDAVSIASPIGLHYSQGRQALLAGKHIHFNKTMTTTVAEASELIALASARELKIVASPGEVLRPEHQRVKQLIAEGALGQLCWAVCGAAFGRYHEEEEFRTDADDNTLILLDFGDSLFALAYGTAAGSVAQGFSPSFFGTSGAIVGRTLNGQPFDYPGKAIADQAPSGVGAQWLLPHVVGPHRQIGEQHVYEDIMQLVDWIREGTPSPVTAEHARHVIDIIESAYRSAETSQAQELTTTF